MRSLVPTFLLTLCTPVFADVKTVAAYLVDTLLEVRMSVVS